MWRMSAVCLVGIIGSVHPCLADVMDEYRDPKFTGGYVVGEYLFKKTEEQDQKSYALYGEYDLHPNVTLYSRVQYASLTAKTIEGMAPDKPKDSDHISAIGPRLRYRFGKDGQHEVGALLTLAHRDFGEVSGESYRFMHYVYIFSGRTFSVRAHLEYDFISESSWNAEKETGRNRDEQREAGLYLRANLTNIAGWISPSLQPRNWSLSYEDKLATNIDEDGWDISHEHTVSWDHSNGLSVIVAQQKYSPESTANINPFKKVTKAGYTTLSVKRQF